MTNEKYLRTCPIEEFARLIVQEKTRQIFDYDWDENLIDTGFVEDYFVTGDGEEYGDYDEAVSHQINWLLQDRGDVSNHAFMTNSDIQAYSKIIFKRHPELRFLQLMYIAAKNGGWKNDDIFYCPDDVLIAGLKKIVDDINDTTEVFK